jgi:hypothetical protein
LGTRTIRITATGEDQSGNIVSTVSRVSGNGDGAGLNPSSARTGTGWALMAQTMLTVLTQNSRPSGGKEIALASRELDYNRSMAIWPRAVRGRRRARTSDAREREPRKLFPDCFLQLGRCFRSYPLTLAANSARTPGPPPFSSMNSTPAASRARRTAMSLAAVIEVSFSDSSARRMVAAPTADSRARSSARHRRNARAEPDGQPNESSQLATSRTGKRRLAARHAREFRAFQRATDLLRQQHQRITKIDDFLQRRAKQVVLTRHYLALTRVCYRLIARTRVVPS